MSSAIIVGLVAIVACVSAALEGERWHQYKREHGKSYTSALEEEMRRSIFSKNVLAIERFNEQESGRAGYKLGLSHLADWTRDELNELLGNKPPHGRPRNTREAELFLEKILSSDGKRLPDEVDWRTEPGRVTPVKDQGHCGSCWAFSTTGVLEGQQLEFNENRSELIALSEQNLIDCVTMEGCEGGYPMDGLEQVHKEGGIMSERAYPYAARNGRACRFNKNSSIMSASGFAMLEVGNENQLKEVVAKFGPVSVAIDVTQNFHLYKSGVFQDSRCLNKEVYLNHAVLVVGYGTTSDTGADYWLVKNSWNEKWGESGYFRLARNRGNMCGIATQAVVPTFLHNSG